MYAGFLFQRGHDKFSEKIEDFGDALVWKVRKRSSAPLKPLSNPRNFLRFQILWARIILCMRNSQFYNGNCSSKKAMDKMCLYIRRCRQASFRLFFGWIRLKPNKRELWMKTLAVLYSNQKTGVDVSRENAYGTYLYCQTLMVLNYSIGKGKS